MDFDFIIKIIVYMIIVRIIMSKVNKKKNMRSNNRENTTPRRSNRQSGNRMQKKNNRNIDLNSFRDRMPKSNKVLSPEERMKQREKELENMNKR